MAALYQRVKSGSVWISVEFCTRWAEIYLQPPQKENKTKQLLIPDIPYLGTGMVQSRISRAMYVGFGNLNTM